MPEKTEYVVNLKSLADANGDKCFGAKTLYGERHVSRYISNCSKWFEYAHFFVAVRIDIQRRRMRTIISESWMEDSGGGRIGYRLKGSIYSAADEDGSILCTAVGGGERRRKNGNGVSV